MSLEIEGIDRMYLNVYVPQLQRRRGRGKFLSVPSWISLCVQWQVLSDGVLVLCG
ncbi:MAG: hypothetical protein ACREXW_00655 [Gammaproteobacteria bacterium]